MPIVTILLAIGLLLISLRYVFLRREIGRMARAIEEIHPERTNRQLTVHTQTPQVKALATAINTLYLDMDEGRAANRAALDEMRQSMANISHDLRTPLTSILGYLKLLQGGGNSPEQAQRYLDIAENKARALHRLVGGLFDLARLESGGYALAQQRLDATTVLADELAGMYTRMTERGITPEISMPDSPLWIIGDRDALARIFSNMLQNMVKHGTMPMRISAQAEENMAVFRFTNRAEGLSPDAVPMLFSRFFTNDRMRSGKDTGLGLAIVKEFAEQMQGSVSAELAEDILIFTLRLPLR